MRPAHHDISKQSRSAPFFIASSPDNNPYVYDFIGMRIFIGQIVRLQTEHLGL